MGLRSDVKALAADRFDKGELCDESVNKFCTAAYGLDDAPACVECLLIKISKGKRPIGGDSSE